MSKLKKVFVYTELQISVPFEEVPWKKINDGIKKQEGFVRKTWLSGIGTQTVGGLYEFNSLENAQKFAWDYFPNEPRTFGVSFQTKIFDGEIVEDASRDMKSPHYNY
ncbi:YdhR family protein [Flaviramulus aquimarinus]|uniref:YdhR family protein n=1 Tax=Flaviramulus aquimarinus TaxID=1170456 RepID=A0ABP9F047_9FLAO